MLHHLLGHLAYDDLLLVADLSLVRLLPQIRKLWLLEPHAVALVDVSQYPRGELGIVLGGNECASFLNGEVCLPLKGARVDHP